MIPDITIIFELDGQERKLAYRKLPFSVWGELKSRHNFTPKTLMTAVGDWDLDAIGALIWLERKQRERKLSWNEVQGDLMSENHDFSLVDLVAEGRSLTTGEKQESEEDPTTGD